jgi:hypothetical protein
LRFSTVLSARLIEHRICILNNYTQNCSYQELAEYYGTAIVPARVRKSQDKSATEAFVRFAETWIIAALRGRKFFSTREVNEAIAEKLEELNNRPFQRMAGTRRSAWLEEEKS